MKNDYRMPKDWAQLDEAELALFNAQEARGLRDPLALNKMHQAPPGWTVVLDQPLYFKAVAAAGVGISELVFLSSSGKADITNLGAEKQLSGDQVMLVRSLALYSDPFTDLLTTTLHPAGEVNAFLRGAVEMKVSGVTQFESLVSDLPGGRGIYMPLGRTDAAATVIPVLNGTPQRNEVRQLSIPIWVGKGQQFGFSALFPTTNFTPTTAFAVYLMLGGVRFRPPS